MAIRSIAMTNSTRFAVVLVALLGNPWAAWTALGQNTETAELTAASALEKARQALAAFSSIQYEFRAEMIGPGKQSNQSKRSEWGRFEYADGKSRSEFVIDADDFKSNRTLPLTAKTTKFWMRTGPLLRSLLTIRIPMARFSPLCFRLLIGGWFRPAKPNSPGSTWRRFALQTFGLQPNRQPFWWMAAAKWTGIPAPS